VRHGDVDGYEPRGPNEVFGVRLTLHAPHGRYRSAAAAIKGSIDGAIAGFQAQADFSLARQGSQHLAVSLGVPAAEIYESLVGTDRALLGVADRLVDLRGAGVQWKPDDHECVAAELRLEQISGAVCSIAGQISILESINQTPLGAAAAPGEPSTPPAIA